MEARSRSSSGPVLPHTFTLKRTHSDPRHFNSSPSSYGFVIHSTFSPTRATCASSYSSSAYAAASSSINFTGETSASQVRSPSPQVRSPSRPISPKGSAPMKPTPCAQPRKTCMCSPTNHPGSFRCSVHRNTNNPPSSATHSQLNTRRSAITNSLARIGGVEGEWVRRSLTALIRPSSHCMQRRTSFEYWPTRLWHMTRAQDAS